jgi:membrane protease YdiL (CAAX protease family)
MSPHRSIVAVAVIFEAALGLAGIALAWSLGVPLADRLRPEFDMVGRTALALLPMIALLAIALQSHWKPLARLRELVQTLVREYFGAARWWELAAVALAAGFGEELLFRGALQPLAERWWGQTAGLVAVSVLFGLLHAASATYLILAVSMGLYLGWLAQNFGELITPIAVHAAYDWAALALLIRPRGDTVSSGARPVTNSPGFEQ